MNEENLQIILQSLTLEELKELQASVEKYIKSKDMINLYRDNQRKWEKEILKKPKPTQKELDLARNIKLARKISTRKRNTIKGELLNSHQIKSLSIDDLEFKSGALEGPYYVRLFFDKTKKRSQDKVMHYLIALISIAITALLIKSGFYFNLPSISLLSIVPFIVSISNIYKGSKLKNIIEYVPKKNLTSVQISNFSRRLKKDYNIEKENADAMNINEKLFLESKKDSFEGMIKIHDQILLEESKKIAEILNVYPSSLNEEDIEELDIAIKPVKQKVIRMSK